MHENAHKQHSQQHEHQHEANDFIARIPSVQVLSAGWLGVRGQGTHNADADLDTAANTA